jgi:hypothetical protein
MVAQSHYSHQKGGLVGKRFHFLNVLWYDGAF